MTTRAAGRREEIVRAIEECGVEAIRSLSATLSDDMLVGAGTVLDPATAEKVIDAGARFVVAPASKPRRDVSRQTCKRLAPQRSFLPLCSKLSRSAN